MRYVKRFQDLEVYQRQRRLSQRVFQISASFPSEERYSLTDQVRRSARSVGAQIAEAWGKRLYPKHFVSKLTDSDSEQLETQHWLMEANDCGYLEEAEFAELTALCEEIGRMLYGMMQKAELFARAENPAQSSRSGDGYSFHPTDH